MEKLPPVAKSFYTHCKKCETDRYHKVLAHVNTTSAKIMCEVCGGKSTYKLESEKAAASRAKSPGLKRNGKSASEKTRDAHERVFGSLKDKVGTGNLQTYNMRSKFDAQMAIDHPKFGVGFVASVTADKIAVVFADSERWLVHNRA